MVEQLLSALIDVLAWPSLLAMIFGTCLGMMLGAIPGLSATMGIALAIPFTYGMDPLAALGLLAGIHNGASQGGAIPAILFRIPGTSGALVTTWDGYPMAKQGHAAAALKLSAISSAVGGMLSALALMILAPPLAKITLAFGPAELFWVNVFGLSTVVMLIGNDVWKGIVSACLGMALGVVGMDIVTGQQRFTFGVPQLLSGMSVLVVMVGLFSLPPAWEMGQKLMADGTAKAAALKYVRGVWSVAQVARAWLISSLIGIIWGILPGSGSASAFIAYSEARRASKEPERFGKGSPEGLAAAEAVNNADNAAAMIPALTLGVPGSGIAALMLGALLIQGFQPGPRLFAESPNIVYGYTWQMFITSALLIFFGGIVANRLFAQVLRVPQMLLMPLVISTTVLGVFAYQNSMFDVYMMLGFGAVGVAMDKLRYPIAPAVIGLILSGKAEYNFRLALLLSHGDPATLWTRPISQVLIGLTLLIIAYPLIMRLVDRRRKSTAAGGRKSQPEE